jgi:hypothetical protein
MGKGWWKWLFFGSVNMIVFGKSNKLTHSPDEKTEDILLRNGSLYPEVLVLDWIFNLLMLDKFIHMFAINLNFILEGNELLLNHLLDSLMFKGKVVMTGPVREIILPIIASDLEKVHHWVGLFMMPGLFTQHQVNLLFGW